MAVPKKNAPAETEAEAYLKRIGYTWDKNNPLENAVVALLHWECDRQRRKNMLAKYGICIVAVSIAAIALIRTFL